MSTVEEIRIDKPYLPTWRWANVTPQQKQAVEDWKVEWAEFNQAIDRGEDVYLKVTNPAHKHYDSIAKVTERQMYDLHGQSSQDWTQQDAFWITLGWDKRKNAVQHYTGYNDMVWLKGFTGDTVYNFDRTRGAKTKAVVEAPKDKLGREIKVGDFCAYILYHYDTSGAAIYFGNVTKISDKTGAVYCTNIKLKSKDSREEKRVTYTSNIVILTKDLMDQLMLAKLSAL